MRELEKKFYEKKKAEVADKMQKDELKEFETVIAPAMATVDSMLKESGDSLSHEGLEAIARWKLGK